MASTQVNLLSMSGIIPDRSGNTSSEHVTTGFLTPDANALREAALKSRRKKKNIIREQLAPASDQQTIEVNTSQPYISPVADGDSPMHDASVTPAVDTSDPQNNPTDTEDGEIPESSQENEPGGVRSAERDTREKTPHPLSDVKARSTSIPRTTESLKNVRPGLDMTSQDLAEAKHLILDLLGLGVTPEYLVDCGVSPQCLAVCFYELNLRFPLNLDRRQINLPPIYNLDRHMKDSQRREQIIRQRDRGRIPPRPTPPVMSTSTEEIGLSSDRKASPSVPEDMGDKLSSEPLPSSHLDMSTDRNNAIETPDNQLSENARSSPAKEPDITLIEDQERMELLARKAAMDSINKKRAAKTSALSSNISGQSDARPYSMDINDVESAVDALLASVRINSESSNHSEDSSNNDHEGGFVGGEEQLSDYDSDAMVEDELETRSPSPSDPDFDEPMDAAVLMDNQRNISPDPILPAPLLIPSPKHIPTRVRFDAPDQSRSSSLPAQPTPIVVPVVARRSRPIASDFIDQAPPRPSSTSTTPSERSALLKRKRSFVDPAVWPKRIVIDLDSSDEEEDQDEAAPGFVSSSNKSGSDGAPSRTGSQDQTGANGQDQAAQMLLEKELQIKAMMQKIKMRELQKKKSASGSRTPMTGTVTPATAADVNKTTPPTVESPSSPITSAVNLAEAETSNSEILPTIPVVTQEVPSLVEKEKDSALDNSLGSTSPKMDKGKGKALEPEGISQDDVTISSTVVESDNGSRLDQLLNSNSEQALTHFKTYVSPLAGFTSPDLQRSSPTDHQLSSIFWISSSAGQDVNRQLCMYEFPSGVCRNETCKDIHVRDFGASEDEIRNIARTMFPNARPEGLSEIVTRVQQSVQAN